MRVITGSAKGRRLKTLPGLEVRPTIEGVKEAIFSIVQFEIEGAIVLDMFAGSGQLGIEALSRGAKKVYFVDNSAESVKVIRDNLKHTRLEENAVVSNTANNHKLIRKTMPALVEKMSEGGIIICEHERETELPERFGEFGISKVYRHGRATLTAYRRSSEEKTEEQSRD